MSRRPILLALCAAVAGGCAVLREPQGADAQLTDAVLTTRVKARFAADPLVGAMTLAVDTFDGIVLLSGVVESDRLRHRAGDLALSVVGVRRVANNIVVRS